jgi:hypothetical protein
MRQFIGKRHIRVLRPTTFGVISEIFFFHPPVSKFKGSFRLSHFPIGG